MAIQAVNRIRLPGDALDPLDAVPLQQLPSSPTTQDLTLLEANWQGASAPFQYDLTISGITATSVGQLGLSNGATGNQAEQLALAFIRIGEQTTNQLTIYADGDKPSVNIPVTYLRFA